MSLIQDALRRQHEERDGFVAPAEEPTPPSPPTAGETEEPAHQEPEPIPEKQAKPRVWMIVSGIVLLIALVIGTAGYLISLSVSLVAKKNREKTVAPISEAAQPGGASPAQAEPDAVPSRPAAVPAAESPLVSPPVAGAAPSAPVLPVPPPEDSVKAPEPGPQPLKPPPDEPVASAKPAAEKTAGVSKPEPKRVRPAAKKPAPEPAVVPKELPPMEWPKLRLTAVLSGLGQGQDAARINGTMVPVGGEIEGVTLLEVKPEGALLKYGHEIRFLRMGASLY